MGHEETGQHANRAVVISTDSVFCDALRLAWRETRASLTFVSTGNLRDAITALETEGPAVILWDAGAKNLAATAALIKEHQEFARLLSEWAPLVVIGNAELQGELAEILRARAADFVERSECFVAAAVELMKRGLRKERAASADCKLSLALPGIASTPPVAAKDQDFGEVLRHELNNPLTGILGNAELELMEMRREKIAMPEKVETRLETIAILAVRMRETVRRLSDEWVEQQEKNSPQLIHEPN